MVNFQEFIRPFLVRMHLVEPPKSGVTVVYQTVRDGILAITPNAPQIWVNRTGLEKWLIGGTAFFVMWKVYDCDLQHTVANLFGFCFPGVKWVRRQMFEPVVVDDRGLICLESYREGSKETAMPMPKFQCGIMIENSKGEFRLHGHAIRFTRNWLVAPAHVLDDTITKYAKGSQRHISLKGKERIPLATDLVGVKLTEGEWSTIGCQTAAVGMVPYLGTLVTVAVYGNEGTSETLVHDSKIFGRVIYNGTTRPGYSGAAYEDTGRVVGIHTHGGESNGGINASYVLARLNYIDRHKQEDSAEWLETLFRTQGDIKYKEYGADEIMIMGDDGRYDLVDRSNVVKVFGANYANRYGVLSLKKRPSYQDEVLECASSSGEANSSKNSGALNTLELPRDFDISQFQELIQEYCKLSKTKQRSVHKLVVTTQQHADSIAGPMNSSGQPAT